MKAIKLGLLIVGILSLLYLIPGVAALPSVDNCNGTASMVINASSELNNSIKNNGTCITIGADNVTFDCSGFTVTFGVNLTQDGEFPAFGINISNRNNVTIRSCTVQLGDQNSNATGMIGINITNSTNVIILNTTIVVNASAGNNRGILFQNTSRSFVTDVNIRVSNGTNSYGIYFLGSANNSVSNANITTNGSANCDAIRIEGLSTGNSINDTNITTNGTLSYAFIVLNSNGTTLNNTLITIARGATGEWMNFTPNTQSTTANTTFRTTNGSINFRGSISITGPAQINRSALNISGNLSRVNSSNLSMFNTSAYITLNDIIAPDPAPYVDFTDTSTAVACPQPTMCREISYVNNEFIFTVTQFTSYTIGAGNANITLTKTDSVDPVPEDSLITYYINVTNNGTTNATNINLTDLYPSLFVFSSTTGNNVSGNNTFLIGNLSPGQSTAFTVTLRAGSVNNLTIVQNTINITFTNGSGELQAFNITETTNVTNVVNPAGGSTSGGGGGGGGTSSSLRSMTTDSATYSLRKSDRVAFRYKNIQHLITIISILSDSVVVRVASTPQEFTIKEGKSQDVDIEQDGIIDLRLTLLDVSYATASLKVELLGSCVPSWSCDVWSTCMNGQQTRTCSDARRCGTMANKPAESQACVTEPQPAAEQPPEPAPEAPVAEQEPLPEAEAAPVAEEQLPVMGGEPTGISLNNVFYGLAILALVGLGVYWYFLQRKKS